MAEVCSEVQGGYSKDYVNDMQFIALFVNYNCGYSIAINI